MLWGVSSPTYGPSFAQQIKAAGAGMPRIVATGRPDMGTVLDEYRQVGLQTLLVLARESLVTYSGSDWVEHYARRYADLIAAVQVGNEPDAGGGHSSWQVTPGYIDELIVRAQAFKEKNPACKIVGPGLISGRQGAPAWLAKLKRTDLLDAVAWHPYWEPPIGLDTVAARLDYGVQPGRRRRPASGVRAGAESHAGHRGGAGLLLAALERLAPRAGG